MGMLNNLMDNIIQFFEPMAVFKGTIGTVMGIYHESLEEIIRFSNKLWAFIDRCIELNVSFVLELFNRIEALSAFIKEINSYVSMLKLMEPDKITAHVFGSFKELKSHEPWLSLLSSFL